jgi:hypothetical protein
MESSRGGNGYLRIRGSIASASDSALAPGRRIRKSPRDD